MERMLGELASIVPPSSLPVTDSLTSDNGLGTEGSCSKDDTNSDETSEPSSSIDRLALLRKRLEESAEPEEEDSTTTINTATRGNSLTLTVNSTADMEDDETTAMINILPPTPTVPSKPGGFEDPHSTSLSADERTSSVSGKNSLSAEDALTPRGLANDKDSLTTGKAVSESVTVPTSGGGSHSNGSSGQGSPHFSPGVLHNTLETNAKVCTVFNNIAKHMYMYIVHVLCTFVCYLYMYVYTHCTCMYVILC